MRAYTGSRGTAPIILDLGTRWRLIPNIKLELNTLHRHGDKKTTPTENHDLSVMH
jgi:hypothetical protein